MKQLKTGDLCRILGKGGIRLRGKVGTYLGLPYCQTIGGKTLIPFERAGCRRLVPREALRKLPSKQIKEVEE